MTTEAALAHLQGRDDAEQLDGGQTCPFPSDRRKLFEKYIPEIFTLLLLRALPLSYTCAHGAHVLVVTGRLAARTRSPEALTRRLMETAQFVMDCMVDGAFETDGKGFVTAIKVRIIHATIRYLIRAEKAAGWNTALLGPEWQPEIEGLPINQEDLAGTLLTFSVAILSGLMILGVKLARDDIDAWIHTWNFIGHLLGVQEELRATDYDHGYALAKAILAHQAQPSEWGRELTEALIGFIDYIVPGSRFEKLCRFLLVYLLSDIEHDVQMPLHEYIGLSPDHDIAEFSLRLLQKSLDVVEFAKDRLLLVRKLIPRFHPLLMQGIIFHFNEYKRVSFQMPDRLQGAWMMPIEGADERNG
jgi:ER-bound oxygenase mpaB/B'/Rubber oxygenase, catalytic domain